MQYFSIQEVAKQFDVGERVVLAWVATNQLAAVNIARDPAGGRPTWRIAADELERFKAARLRTPPPPRTRRRKRPAGVIEFYK